jgi:hypothetical protein
MDWRRLVASVLATVAYAAQQDFTTVNDTGQVMLNVSPSDENKSGTDVLGAGEPAQNKLRSRRRALRMGHPRHLSGR